MNYELQMSSLQQDAEMIMRAALKAVDPYVAVTNAIQQSPDLFNPIKKLTLLSVGKASPAMAHAVIDQLSSNISSSLIITKYDHMNAYRKLDKQYQFIESGHPIPDDQSVKAGEKAIELLQTDTESDTVVVCLSGGGSALMTKPIAPYTLRDMQSITQNLLQSGADITEINTIRKLIDDVKGGGLMQYIVPHKKLIVLVLSDVIDDDLGTIASGPTVRDIEGLKNAPAIIEKYALDPILLSFLKKKIDISNTQHARIHFTVGNNDLAVASGLEKAEEIGYHAYRYQRKLTGEAREEAVDFVEYLRTMHHFTKPICVIAGGEPVVHIKGNGKGGRNQEFALASAIALEGMEDTCVYSFGTDGTDGPTDAAGAVVDGTTTTQGRLNGLNAQQYLDNNDSYTYFSAVGGLITTGPTGTNVNDIVIGLIG